MHIISRKLLREFCQKHADCCEALDDWYQIAKAEAVGNFTVFNIKGNNYRLIVSINYIKQIIYIKYVLTHAEYDKNTWKRNPYF
jgi:mRNA interferase HigB